MDNWLIFQYMVYRRWRDGVVKDLRTDGIVR
jgi:hypothetical protein